MKYLTKKESVARKILIILLITLILVFAITPNYKVWAVEVIEQEDMPDEGEGILGSLLKQIIQIIVAVGDIVMGTLNHFMLGADGFTSAMLSPDNDNFDEEKGKDSWLIKDIDKAEVDYEYDDGTINTAEFFTWILGDQYDIPNFLYSPENIFANNIAALDVNFLNPNDYTQIAVTDNAEKASDSAASGKLREVIADWYISFRNISIVGLLSVLVYLGIRILISSTAVDKAKYKESLQNWLVALCLVFIIHFIMSGLLMITDKFTNLFGSTIDNGIVIKVDNIKFRTNLIGLVRFNAQSVSLYNTAAYSILYWILVIYTCMFTFMYFKRFLYMAFFTMIAPLVALTYPIDKAGDGKAQAFNLWFKEYIMNLILQPVHLILYVAFVSTAFDLVKQNMIYAIVAIGFLIPAEKFIKKMFGMDKAETPSGFGSFAAGAATMSGLKQVASMLGGRGKGKQSNPNGTLPEGKENPNNGKVRTQDGGFLGSFGGNDNPELDEGTGDDSQFRQQDIPNDEEAQSPEHQRMLDDREAWQNIADDPNTSDLDREEALQNIDFINDDMREKGFLNNEQEQIQDQNSGQGQVEDSNRDFNNINQSRKGWRKKLAITGAKKALKVAYKGAKIGAQGLGMAGGAMVGLAAGAATGDFKNALSFMGAGAIAGRSIGKAAGNLPEGAFNLGKRTVDSIKDKAENAQYEYDKARYGVGVAAENAAIRQNEREEAKFLKNKEEKAKYEEMAGRIYSATGKNVSTEDLMQSAFDYKKAGITDEKDIEKGLTMETRYKDQSGIHENMIDIVNMTKSYGKDYVMDEKKRNSMQQMIKANVSGEKNQNKVWDLYTETLGSDVKKYGKQYAINSPRKNPPKTSGKAK